MTTDYNDIENAVNFKDLQEDDKLKVINTSFKNFKELFKWDVMNLGEDITLVLAVRQFVENTHSQNHTVIVDGNKKHQWLCHKTYDLLKVNSIYIIKGASEKRLAELKAEQESNRTFAETASDKTNIEDTTGERRFHVVE